MYRKKIIKHIIICVLSVLLILLLIIIRLRNSSQKAYTSEELGIKVLTSTHDEDYDGVDDYTDICEGAKAYIATKPKYKSKYYTDGYPNDGYGVCTDVIWNALKAAGYDLKSYVDTDIKKNKDNYTINKADPNIDFRRVINLNVFFQHNAELLTTNLDDPEQWQAGDIVVFTKHIAICSDKRNKNGIPFIIHHGTKGAREANEIGKYKIIGHYRWNRVNE